MLDNLLKVQLGKKIVTIHSKEDEMSLATYKTTFFWEKCDFYVSYPWNIEIKMLEKLTSWEFPLQPGFAITHNCVCLQENLLIWVGSQQLKESRLNFDWFDT